MSRALYIKPSFRQRVSEYLTSMQDGGDYDLVLLVDTKRKPYAFMMLPEGQDLARLEQDYRFGAVLAATDLISKPESFADTDIWLSEGYCGRGRYLLCKMALLEKFYDPKHMVVFSPDKPGLVYSVAQGADDTGYVVQQNVNATAFLRAAIGSIEAGITGLPANDVAPPSGSVPKPSRR